MLKRVLGITVALLVVGMIALTGAGIWLTQRGLPTFSQNGYVLQSEGGEVRQLAFAESENYKLTKLGYVTFEETSGDTASVEQSSFLHLEGGGVGSFSDGVLLDFNDLSTNFINNYYITEGVVITPSGEGYTAQTNSGSLTFGDHLWKLSDDRYMIQSSELTVHFSEEDERSVADFVEVRITQDGIVELLTQENQWSTISEECYIQTASGVKVYPITQIVENEEYKMSLAKLAVNTDDSIVLTEDETRRQIVPELNITGVDGEDGSDGDVGAQGEAGMMGGGGETGSSGQTGQNGTSGAGGASGADGGNGAAGKDAITESTVNSALPTMSIGAWEVTATTLRGAILVKDENSSLSSVVGTSGNSYEATVTIYNQNTGEAISCFSIDGLAENEWPDGYEDDAGFDEFLNGQDEVYFATQKNALEPDTTYRLSVVAYYQMDEMIYSREFINRIFYTDSTGVILSKDTAEPKALTVKSSIAQAYQESVARVSVFLLTPEQNEKFTIASGDSGTNYQGKYVLDYQDPEGSIWYYGPDGDSMEYTELLEPDMSLKFPDLDSNTKYIARVYVETKTGLKTLTSQELELLTLKTPPTWTAGDEPKANYNRATGAFEVYRPSVEDLDLGIVSYIYTACDQAGNVVRSQEVDAARGEPISFFLESGKQYTFKVEAIFDDNEKEVTYYLGTSDLVQSYGDKLPQITLTPTGDPATEFDKFTGDLTINLTSANSNLMFNKTHPLTLSFYADSLNSGDLAFEISLTDTNPVQVGNNGYQGTATYSLSASNYPTVRLALENLYNNTQYTIVVSGWLNLGDGKGPVYQTIGTTGFRTLAPANLAATWSTASEDTGATISQNLKLAAANTTEDQNRESYALEQLRSGSVRLELYNGTGVNKVRIAYTDITSTTELEQLYSTGIDITEKTFGGSLTLSPGVDYTLLVSTVTDDTYNMDLGYQNVFSSVANATKNITGQSTPPDLLADPAQGVKVTPIYNEDAPKYGALYDENQPDDLLIGYKLQSTYDNVQRLGYDVTYYAMEYSQFYNALLSGNDPIKEAGHLMEVSEEISAASDTVPAVVFLFGGEEGKYAGYHNQCDVYYTGEAQLTDGTLSGMGRGYRYVFAYTVRYSTTGNLDEEQLSVYPYSHPDYNAYKSEYGAGLQYGKYIGKNIAYVLNSGMYEAPRMDPEIHTLVYKAEPEEEINGMYTQGKVTIQYKYRDLDHTIDVGSEPGKKTQVIWEDADGQLVFCNIDKFKAQYIDDESTQADAGDGWYEITVPYRISAVEGQPTTGLVAPILDIDRYGIDYSKIMKELTEDTAWEELATDVFYLCQVPVDWAWGDRINDYQDQLRVDVDLSKAEENVITFKVTGDVGSSAAAIIAERLYAMKLTFSYVDETGTHETEPIYLPVSVGADGKPYAELATGRIANLVSKTVKYSAELLYDNGELGWRLVDDQNAMFALQIINGTGENSETFGFESYFSSVAGGTGASPSGALLVHASETDHLSMQKFYNSLDNVQSPKKVYGTTRYLTSASGSILGRFYYVDHNGMDVSTDADLDSLTGRYVVPKGCGVLAVKAEGNGEFPLDHITPAIAMGNNYRPTTSKLEVFHSFSIDGAANADPVSGEESDVRRVYMAVFKSQEEAQELGQPVDTKYIDVVIGDDGTAKPSNPNGRLSLEGLEKNTSYWLVAYMVIDGEPTILMDAQTAQKAIYRFTAVDDVLVESAQGMVYYNNSYFEKYFQMKYTVTPSLGFEAHYAIYETGEDYENAMPLYSDVELDSILTAPKDLTSSNCELTLNLEPSQNRDKLIPGRTYYLRVYITEQGGEEVVGESTFPFTISPVGNTGVLIYAKNATEDSVTFQVTLSDPQFSYMGRKKDSIQTNEGALYAVRFTAKDGNKEYLLVTDYDNELYKGNELQKEFELSEEHLVLRDSVRGQEINPDTEYSMHVFAVPDLDHDGQVAIDESGENLQDYKWFFGESEADGNFLNLIDRIWDHEGGSYQELDSHKWIKNLYEKGIKSQMTTDQDGILVNEMMASILRIGTNTLQLNLAESYGIVTVGDDGQARQSFPLVRWSVVGVNNPVILSGESKVSNGDKIFTLTEDAQGYQVYTYDIPAQLTSGQYLITIQLYRNENGVGDFEELSLVYRG